MLRFGCHNGGYSAYWTIYPFINRPFRSIILPMANQLPPSENVEETKQPDRTRLLYAVIGAVVALGIVTAIFFASIWMIDHPDRTATLRDIFIIFMAFTLVFIGFVLVILLVQLARLTNLLQHEIKPILENTNETINTVRGTAIFLSESITEPVTKLNSYVAGLSRFFELILPRQGKPKK